MDDTLIERLCDTCGGYGEFFAHADDCHNDLCALAGGYDDCAGKVELCSCESLWAQTGEPA